MLKFFSWICLRDISHKTKQKKISAEYYAFLCQNKKLVGVSHAPAARHPHKAIPRQSLGCNCGTTSGRLLRREAPQSGSGISHYQYDNNNSIHLVKLKVSSPWIQGHGGFHWAWAGLQLPRHVWSTFWRVRTMGNQFITGLALSRMGCGRRGRAWQCVHTHLQHP